MEFFLLTVGACFLTVGVFFLTVGIFSYNWNSFAYNGKVCLRSSSMDCKQRSSTAIKKAPIVNKKASPRAKSCKVRESRSKSSKFPHEMRFMEKGCFAGCDT